MAYSESFRLQCRSVNGRDDLFDAVCVLLPPLQFTVDTFCSTSAGLYYFAAKLAPPDYAALSSWITGARSTLTDARFLQLTYP